MQTARPLCAAHLFTGAAARLAGIGRLERIRANSKAFSRRHKGVYRKRYSRPQRPGARQDARQMPRKGPEPRHIRSIGMGARAVFVPRRPVAGPFRARRAADMAPVCPHLHFGGQNRARFSDLGSCRNQRRRACAPACDRRDPRTKPVDGEAKASNSAPRGECRRQCRPPGLRRKTARQLAFTFVQWCGLAGSGTFGGQINCGRGRLAAVAPWPRLSAQGVGMAVIPRHQGPDHRLNAAGDHVAMEPLPCPTRGKDRRHSSPGAGEGLSRPRHGAGGRKGSNTAATPPAPSFGFRISAAKRLIQEAGGQDSSPSQRAGIADWVGFQP